MTNLIYSTIDQGEVMPQTAAKLITNRLSEDGFLFEGKSYEDIARRILRNNPGASACVREVKDLIQQAVDSGKLLPYQKRGVLKGYRTWTNFEREEQERKQSQQDLRKLRQQKEREKPRYNRGRPYDLKKARAA